jgi:hypothetical protein
MRQLPHRPGVEAELFFSKASRRDVGPSRKGRARMDMRITPAPLALAAETLRVSHDGAVEHLNEVRPASAWETP